MTPPHRRNCDQGQRDGDDGGDCEPAQAAPGTGTPEAGGLTMREAQGMIRRLEGLAIAGADMVEVSPPFDPVGITAIAGASVALEMLCLWLSGRTQGKA